MDLSEIHAARVPARAVPDVRPVALRPVRQVGEMIE